MDAPCTLLVVAATCVVSFLGFRDRVLEEKYIFNPESILAWKEYYRLVTPAFLHAGWAHLVWNMFSLYSFGSILEMLCGKGQFLLIYFGAVIGGNLLSLYVHRHHEYLAYGASGGVCGVIFAHILLLPGSGVSLGFVPVSVPGWLYAIGFLVISFYALRAGRGNIGHDAHLGGAIVGLLIAAALFPAVARFNWKVFLILLLASAAILSSLWARPLFLPLLAFPWIKAGLVNRRRARLPSHRRQALELDEILEKVHREGMEGLTNDEKAFLTEVSGKYQRRAESKKPESDLII